MAITIAVEGPADIPVAQKILATVGFEVGPIHQQSGKRALDKNLRGYNRAAAFSPWLVLRDLDQDAPCAGGLRSRLLPQPSAHMCFRIAVHEIEAWLLADREQMASYLAIPVASVPRDPEALAEPKQVLIQLARASRKRSIREDFVPAAGTTAKVGPGYLAGVSDYASAHWRPEVAAQASRSLASCLAALRRLPISSLPITD